mgnify:FL=1
MLSKASVDSIQGWIEGMAAFNATPGYGTTRVLFTEQELANRAYVKSEMQKLGLIVAEDAIGNIYATHKGTETHLAPVWTGSHIDTVPNAGNFDGMAGVVCGLEAMRLFNECGISHKRDISVIVYTSEEPTRFGLSCLGSRAMSGDMLLEETKEIFDKSGRTLYDKLVELGYPVDEEYKNIFKKEGDVYAAVELHIEQSSRLEKMQLPIGIVKKICAPSNYVVEVTGVQSHAGGTDMTDRRDAFAAVCEMEEVLEKLARECPSEYNTATIGHLEVLPNAMNVIPGKVIFTIDIRDCTWHTKQILIEAFKVAFQKIADSRGVSVSIHEDNNDMPFTCNETIISLIEEACKNQQLEYAKLISGPYHDTLFVGRFAPAAMIFVPSKNGISHSPNEWTEYEQLAQGADVLAETLLKLSNSEESL